MIGIQKNDVCYSTANGGHNPFNTDGIARTELEIDFARTALDFEIQKHQSYDHEGRAIPHQFHLRRSDSNDFIPSRSVGDIFVPVQHKDVFDYITKEIMPKVPQMELEMCGTIHGGGTGLIAAKFGDTFAIKGDQSANEMRLFFSNPCNGTGRLTLGFTTVRVVCQNTLLAATQEAKQDGFLIKHTVNAPRYTLAAVKSIEAQASAALEMKARSERLAEIGVNTATLERCLDAIYPIHNLPADTPALARMQHLRDEVVAQFESGETAQTTTEDNAWKLFNSFTFPVFNPEKLGSRTDKAQIQFQGMVGDKALRVRRIFDTVERVALSA